MLAEKKSQKPSEGYLVLVITMSAIKILTLILTMIKKLFFLRKRIFIVAHKNSKLLCL